MKAHGDSTERSPTSRFDRLGHSVARHVAEARRSPGRGSRRHLHQDRGRFSKHDRGHRPRLHIREPGAAARGDACRHGLSYQLGCRPRDLCRRASRAWHAGHRQSRAIARPEHGSVALAAVPAGAVAHFGISRYRQAPARSDRRCRPLVRTGHRLGAADRLLHRGTPRRHFRHRRRHALRELGRAAASSDEARRQQSRDGTRTYRDSTASARFGRAQRTCPLQRERWPLGLRYPQQSGVSIAALEGDVGVRRKRRGAGAGLANARALRRHVARTGGDSRSCGG